MDYEYEKLRNMMVAMAEYMEASSDDKDKDTYKGLAEAVSGVLEYPQLTKGKEHAYAVAFRACFRESLSREFEKALGTVTMVVAKDAGIDFPEDKKKEERQNDYKA